MVSLTNYGCFIELEPGVEGLIHVSEISWTKHIKNPAEVYSMGDEVEAKVLFIDSDERKIMDLIWFSGKSLVLSFIS